MHCLLCFVFIIAIRAQEVSEEVPIQWWEHPFFNRHQQVLTSDPPQVNITVRVNKGAILESVGEFTVSGNHWVLAIDYYMENIDNDFYDIQKAMDTLKKSLQTTDLSINNSTFMYIHDMIDDIRLSKLKTLEYLQSVLDDLKLGNVDLKRVTLKMQLKSRKKRWSIMPLVGQASKVLFGTATSDDIDELNNRLESQASAFTEILQFEDEQATLLLAAQRKILENRQLIQHLGRTTTKMRHSITNLEEAVQDIFHQLSGLQIMSHVIGTTHAIQESIDLLITALDTLRTEISELMIALSAAANGNLDKYFLDTNKLHKVLEEIKKKLPTTMQLAIRADDTQLYTYYQNVRVITVSLNNKIRLLVDIPLTVPGKTFHLTKVHSWPTIPHNKTGLAYMLDSKVNFIGISSDRQSFIELTEQEAIECMSGIKVCSPHSGIFSHPLKSCLYGLIRGHSTHQECSYKVAEITQPRILRLGQSNKWAYYVPSPLSLTISCLDKPSYDKRIADSGIISLESGCSAYAKGIEIPRQYKMHSKVDSNKDNKIMMPKIPQLKLDLFSVQTPNFNKTVWLADDVKVSSLDSIKDIGVNIKKLKHKIAVETSRVKNTERIDYIESHIGFTGWVVVVLLIVFLVIVIVRFRKKLCGCLMTETANRITTFMINPADQRKPTPMPRQKHRRDSFELEADSDFRHCIEE